MDSFMRRLKYYGIGFGIGLVFVLVFFQNRGCSWLPSNRVKNSVLERVLVVSDVEQMELKKRGISKKDVIAALNEGDVVFGESKKDGELKVYAVDQDIEGKGTVRFYFTLPKESYVTELNVSAKKAGSIKTTREGKGKILRFPNEKNLIFVDTNKLLLCQQKAIGLSESSKMFTQWKKTATIDFGKSDLSRSPKPEHFVEFQDRKGRWIGSKSVWYKNKIDISYFEIPFETGCK
jgi:hypothetical protein